jgi:hypothetical protein
MPDLQRRFEEAMRPGDRLMLVASAAAVLQERYLLPSRCVRLRWSRCARPSSQNPFRPLLWLRRETVSMFATTCKLHEFKFALTH